MLRAIDSLTEWLSKICSYAIPLIIVFIVYEIISRQAFGSSVVWEHETVQFLFGFYFIAGGIYASLHNTHLTMDIFYKRFSPRGKAIINLVGRIFLLLFIGVMLWQGSRLAGSSWAKHEVSTSSWRVPLYPIKTTIPIVCFLILLQEIGNSIRDFRTVVTRRQK